MAARPRRSTHLRARLRLRRHHLLLLLPIVLLFLLPPLSAVLFRRANILGRRCLSLAAGRTALPGCRLSFSIVTLSDEGRGARGRSFRGMLNATARNRRAYAAAHGYGLAVLPPHAVDTSRPPAWSKVLALRAHLHRHHWLFWNDADTLVTNPDIALETILFSVIGHSDFHTSPDLILTEDTNGVNSGTSPPLGRHSSVRRGFLRLCLRAMHPSHLVPCSGSSSSTSACRSADPSLKNVTVLTAEGRGRAHDGQRPSVYLGAASTTTHRACVLCRAATRGKAGAWRPGSTSSSSFQCLCGRGQEGVYNRDRRSNTVIFSNRIRSRHRLFFIRRSKWSERFLDTWWNHTSFVQFGSTKSGDNRALKHIIDNLPPEEMQAHVRIAEMQCLFNSYPWNGMSTWKSVHHLIFHPSTTWKGVYSDGDFMVHFAGLDDKQGWTSRILKEIGTP